jgi:hypothetical protein
MDSPLRYLFISRRKKAIAVRAFCWLVYYRVSLWAAPVRISKDSIMTGRDESFARRSSGEELTETIVRAVGICSRYVPFASCLTQALAARKMLEREGQKADLKIGVAKDGSILRAHAWLEIEGRIVLGKRPSHSRYFVLT